LIQKVIPERFVELLERVDQFFELNIRRRGGKHFAFTREQPLFIDIEFGRNQLDRPVFGFPDSEFDVAEERLAYKNPFGEITLGDVERRPDFPDSVPYFSRHSQRIAENEAGFNSLYVTILRFLLLTYNFVVVIMNTNEGAFMVDDGEVDELNEVYQGMDAEGKKKMAVAASRLLTAQTALKADIAKEAAVNEKIENDRSNSEHEH
jgi:hypothetical protein